MAEFATTESLELTLTHSARKNLENMQGRVWAIGNEYGHNSEHYQKALLSFQQSLMQILRFGGKVFAEDDLNLIVHSYITLGVIWHRSRDEDHPLLGEWSVHS